MKNTIIIRQTEKSKAILKYKNLIADAFIGIEGTTLKKVEGDKKTPLGYFELGVAFGTHNKDEIITKLNYFKINPYQYWVDDINSKYYNQLVNIRKIKENLTSAEHLIDYPNQYEYAIEIKTNPKNILGLGSAIFIHCSTNKPTAGCVAIEKEKMRKLLSLIDKNTKILIKPCKLCKFIV